MDRKTERKRRRKDQKRAKRRQDEQQRKRAKCDEDAAAAATLPADVAFIFGGPNVHFRCETCGARREDAALLRINQMWQELLCASAEDYATACEALQSQVETITTPTCERCGDRLLVTLVSDSEPFGALSGLSGHFPESSGKSGKPL